MVLHSTIPFIYRLVFIVAIHSSALVPMIWLFKYTMEWCTTTCFRMLWSYQSKEYVSGFFVVVPFRFLSILVFISDLVALYFLDSWKGPIVEHGRWLQVYWIVFGIPFNPGCFLLALMVQLWCTHKKVSKKRWVKSSKNASEAFYSTFSSLSLSSINSSDEITIVCIVSPVLTSMGCWNVSPGRDIQHRSEQ